MLTAVEQAEAIGVAIGRTLRVETVTGAPARTFRQWAADHAHDFR